MKRRPRRGWVWGATILAVLAGAVFLAANRVSPVIEQVPYNQPDLSLQFNSPEDRSSWTADAHIPVDVSVVGSARLARVELWANSRLVAVQLPLATANAYGYSVRLLFNPGLVGKFYLTAVGVTQAGARSTSDVLALDVSPAVGWIDVQTAKQGDTLASLAQQANLPLADVRRNNPSLVSQESLAVGVQVRLPHLGTPDSAASSQIGSQGGGQTGGQLGKTLLPRPLPLTGVDLKLPDLPGQLSGLEGQPIELLPDLSGKYLLPGQSGGSNSSGGANGSQDIPQPIELLPVVPNALQNLWFAIKANLPGSSAPSGLPKAPY